MRKLFNLKSWLTIPEAARHLSTICSEDVCESDVLRLALDGHLKLSVNFVNFAMARKGRIINFPDEKLIEALIRGETPEELRKITFPAGVLSANERADIDDTKFPDDIFNGALKLRKDTYLALSDEVTVLKGIWDLPMLGGDKLDIEHLYQGMTGGPEVTLSNFEGAFVESLDGEFLCQLQEDFDDNPFQRGSNAQLQELKSKIINEKVPEQKASEMTEAYRKDRMDFLERRKSRKLLNNYYPAHGLPDDSVLVVRTDEIRAFERRLLGQEDAEKPLTTRERNGLLTVIAALCEYADIKPSEHGAAARISRLTEDLGASLGSAAIKKYLDDIPQALESKRK